MLVYPDRVAWDGGRDEAPSDEARFKAEVLFRELEAFDPEEYSGIYANEDRNLHWVRFAPDAQTAFTNWRDRLERRIRDPENDDSPIFIQHLSKSRSLMPKLALIFHTCDVLVQGERAYSPVCLRCEQMAERWCECLESHARRLYFHVIQRSENAAWELADKIRKGRLPQVFTERLVKQKHWRALDETTVPDAIEQLIDANWIAPEPELNAGGRKKGRPSPKYRLNPALKR